VKSVPLELLDDSEQETLSLREFTVHLYVFPVGCRGGRSGVCMFLRAPPIRWG